MDIVGKARKLEATLARTMDRAAQKLAKSGTREPLEIRQAIVDAVDERLEPAGRGTQVFPFNRIRISVVAQSRESRARFEAIFDGAQPLQNRIIERLRDAGCETPGLSVRTTFVDKPAPQWTRPDFHIEFERWPIQDVKPAATPEPSPLEITVTNGTADNPAYTLSLARINLGRCSEVRDKGNRLVRINHVAFTDAGGDPNQSVSRRHAHIDYVAAVAEYRVCDDRSAHGTSVVRSGRTIPVPAGSRGIRLESGDEIVLGEARLIVTLVGGKHV